MSPISWGSSEPSPDKKAHFEHVRNEACPYCPYIFGGQRRTKAWKMVQEHVRKKHPEHYDPRQIVETDDARWIPCREMSPVAKMMDDDADAVHQKSEERGEDYDCLICKVQDRPGVEAVRFAISSTVFPDGQAGIFTFAVCNDHRGGWLHEPKDGLVVTDGMFRVDKNYPVDEPWEEDDED